MSGLSSGEVDIDIQATDEAGAIVENLQGQFDQLSYSINQTTSSMGEISTTSSEATTSMTDLGTATEEAGSSFNLTTGSMLTLLYSGNSMIRFLERYQIQAYNLVTANEALTKAQADYDNAMRSSTSTEAQIISAHERLVDTRNVE